MGGWEVSPIHTLVKLGLELSGQLTVAPWPLLLLSSISSSSSSWDWERGRVDGREGGGRSLFVSFLNHLHPAVLGGWVGGWVRGNACTYLLRERGSSTYLPS